MKKLRAAYKFILYTFCIFILHHLLYYPQLTFAAKIEFFDSNSLEITDINQEFQTNVKLSIAAADGTDYYLRGVYFKQSKTDYCGCTWNGSSWYNGPFTSSDGWKNLPQIIISSGSASIILKAKIDNKDSGCKENGQYGFKVQRYTQKGSAAFDEQTELILNINIPTEVPSPTKIPSPTKTPHSTPTTSPLVTKAVSTPTAKPTYSSKTPIGVSSTHKGISPLESGRAFSIGSESAEEQIESSITTIKNDDRLSEIVQPFTGVLGEGIISEGTTSGNENGMINYKPILSFITIFLGLIFFLISIIFSLRAERRSE